MIKMQAWLGKCHITKDNTTYQAIVAAYCGERQAFDKLVQNHLERQGYRLTQAEAVYPAGQWVTLHPGELNAASALARAVHTTQPVEIGELKDIGENQEESKQQSYLIIEEIEGVEPLDAQQGVWPQKTVPDALMEPLFGQPEPTEDEIAHYGSQDQVPPMKTYAIVDAAKLQWGGSEIENCEMPYRCLFKGDAAQELKDVAPYLIELNAETSFTRTLFTHNKNMPDEMTSVHLWHKEPGIYIRSRANFEDLWRHFRQFTQIQDENNKWYFFRFWEPWVLREYLNSLCNDKSEVITWFGEQSEVTELISVTGGALYGFGLEHQIGSSLN